MTAANAEAVKVGPFRIAPRVRDGKATGTYFLDIPPHLAPGGKRERRTFPTKAAASAETKRLVRELQLDGALRGHGPKLSGVTFSEMAKRWMEDQADRVATGKKRESSLVTNSYHLKTLLATFREADGAKIGTKEIVSYQKTRLAAGRAPATINSEVALMRHVLTWAHEHSLVDKVPKIEQLNVPPKRVPLPTLEEMGLILDALPPRTAMLVRFLAETGCRKSEAFALEWSDLDHKQGLVMIQRKADFTPKTQRSDRDIPISLSLLAALKEAEREARRSALASGKPINPLVFPGRGGKKMTDFDKALATAVKAAGVMHKGQPMKLGPHMLRKAHATWQARRGLDEGLLQSRLGHVPGSKVTRANYVHLTTDDQRRAVIDFAEAKTERQSS